MDNPWDSGWGEPAATTTPASMVTPPPPTPWAAEETDISTPSWSTMPDIKWTEPSNAPAALWGNTTDTEHAWNPEEEASYKGISLRPATPVHDDEDTLEVDLKPPSPARTPTPSSPDAFGSFETTIHAPDDDDPWSSSSFPATVAAQNDQWGSAWGSAEPEPSPEDEPAPDEWEVARQQKANMDRQVPPELLRSILQQCAALWPDSDPAQETIKDKDDYTADRFSGMPGVPGLETLSARVAPPLPPLTPPNPFRHTHTAKFFVESLRLTRHLPAARASPMAHLLAAKGSTAWESAVRARAEVREETGVPVGWRVLGEGENKDKEREREREREAEEARNAKKGGLLAFWGRSRSGVVGAGSGAGARGESQERAMSPASVSSVEPPASASPPTSLPSTRTHSRAPSLSIPAVPTPPLTADSPAPIPPPPTLLSPTVTNTPDAVAPDPPPSAVSRFLNRFSRAAPKPVPSPTTPTPVATFSDDHHALDESGVLAVPSAQDEEEEEDNAVLGTRRASLNGLRGFAGMGMGGTMPPPVSQPQVGLGVQGSDLDAIFGSGSVFGSSGVYHGVRDTTPATTARTAKSPGRPPPLSAPSAFQSVTMTSRPSPSDKPLSAFMLPPPPPSSSVVGQFHRHTPPPLQARNTFPLPHPPPQQARNADAFNFSVPPPAPLHPPRSPAPSCGHTPKPSIIAPPTTSLLSNAFDTPDDDDDDQFSAFHSPPPSSSTFVLPPPPSQQQARSTNAFNFSAPAPAPLQPPRSPAPSRGHTPKPSIVAPPTTSLLSNAFDDLPDDDDEEGGDRFPAFHSPPRRPTQRQGQGQGRRGGHGHTESGSTSALSPHSPPGQSQSQYDDSFASSFTYTPQSASTRPLFASQPPNSGKRVQPAIFDDFEFAEFVESPSGSGLGGMGIGMESPSPPVPRNILTPPPKSAPAAVNQTRQLDFDFLGSGGVLSSGSGSMANGWPASSAKPAAPASPFGFLPLASSSSSQSLLGLSSNSSFGVFNAAPAASMSPKPVQPQRTGGLSAQDLSFFEGL